MIAARLHVWASYVPGQVDAGAVGALKLPNVQATRYRCGDHRVCTVCMGNGWQGKIRRGTVRTEKMVRWLRVDGVLERVASTSHVVE